MYLFRTLLLLLSVFIINQCKPKTDDDIISNALIIFNESEERKFTESQKNQIQKIIPATEMKVRSLLPGLPDSITVQLEIVDWDLKEIGGVTGRTQTNNPPVVLIQVSEKYPGGLSKAIDMGLEYVIFHEFHHLYRGWAIQDNRFEQGISIAAINEGLAVVFSSEHTGKVFTADSPPESSIAESWVDEILDLPTTAHYGTWMFEHPDGRRAIGYKAGNYIVSKAISNSGLDILELSELSVEKIYEHAGY